MNPIQTPPQTPGIDEPTGHDDPLDALLTQIINGFFVLTDGQGAVSKWSEPAELLFGLHTSEALGKPLFDSLVEHAPADAEAWRRFLEHSEPPRTRALQEVSAIYAGDKSSFPLELVFVPVKLDEGFDFSLFLEDLSFELPRNLMLARMRQQHPVVVRALRAALETEPQPWDGWRTAGTMVAFRPLQETPWVADELAAREAARAEADIEGEERMDPDPGILGDSIADLDDAAAVVARLLSALERIEDLEKTAADLPAALEEARREAQASRDRAESAERKVNEAREQLELAREEMRPAEDAGDRAGLLERIARLEEALEAVAATGAERATADEDSEASRLELAVRIEAIERGRTEAIEAAEARLEAALAAVEDRTDSDRGDLAGRVEGLERLGLAAADAAREELQAELGRLRAEREDEAAAVKAQLDAVLERADRDRERQAEDARAELAAALERIDQVHRDATSLREQVSEVQVDKAEAQGLAGEDRRRLLELQKESSEAHARLESLRELAEELRAETASAREESADLRARLALLSQDGTTSSTEVEDLRSLISEREAALGHQLAETRRAFEGRETALAQQLAEARGAFEAEQDAVQQREQSLTEQLSAQVADVRRRFEERESALAEQVAETHAALLSRESDGESVPAEAVERIEALMVRVRADLDTLRRADEELRERVEGLTAGSAAGERVEALVAQVRQELEVARSADEGLQLRLASLSAEGETARAEAAAARADVAGVRSEVEEVRRAAHEAGERVSLIDQGAGDVLAEVREVRERLTAVAAAAQAAQESGTAGLEQADELRASVARIGAELEVGRADVARAREDALGARQQAAAAGEAANAAREDAGRARQEAAAATEQSAAVAAQAADAAEQAGKLRHELTAARSELSEAEETATSRIGTLDTRTAELRAGLDELTPRLDALGEAVEQASARASAAGQEQGVVLETVRSEALSAVEELAAAREEIGSVRVQSETILEEVAMARQQSQAAMQRAQEGDAKMEELRSELNFAIATIDELKAGLTSAGQAAIIARREAESAKRSISAESEKNNERVTEVFREILGLATRTNNPGSNVSRRAEIGQLRAKRESEVKTIANRDGRHDFDDAPQPMAVLGLDGKFRELNPAFTKLVGYQEHEFVKAVWPSVHDRSVYAGQTEQLAAMAKGELDTVPFQSSFMHSQGLMVPVNGIISVVRGEDGEPGSLLLVADER